MSIKCRLGSNCLLVMLLASLTVASGAFSQTPPQLDIVATPSSGLTTDKMGATATLNVRLVCNYAPCLTAAVVVTVRSDNPVQAGVRIPGGTSVTSLNLLFPQGLYYTDQTVEIQGRDDGLQTGATAYTITLQASSTDARIDGRIKTITASNLDRTDHNACVPNVIDAFWAIPSVLEKLPVLAELPPMGGYQCPNPHENHADPLCSHHFQGTARTKHGPYLIVTGNGASSEFYVNKLTAKQGITGRWGNNFTTWDNDLQVNYPGNYQISPTHGHAGGLSLFGDFAAIPLEGGPGSLVYFYDLYNPEQPGLLSSATLSRPTYENAGAVAVTKLNGKYLVAVESNNPAEIQFYVSSGGDIRQSQSWSPRGVWSLVDEHGYPFECLGQTAWTATIQNLNFIEQCDGVVYLAVTYNEGSNGCNLGNGHNWMRLYRVDTAAISAGIATNSLSDVAGRTFSCSTEILDYCNFAAGAGLRVSPETRQLMLYSVWYYHEFLYTSLGWRGFIMAAEFAEENVPAGHQIVIPKQGLQAVENGKLIVGREGPDTCLWSRCDSDPVNSLRQRNVPLTDIHYLRVEFQPNGAWNAGFGGPFAQIDDNTRAHAGSGNWPYAFDVFPSPSRDTDLSATGPGGVPDWNAYFGTLRFVEQDDQGDNFGGAGYNGWPRSWTAWKTECGSLASGSADKAGLGVRFWATGTDLSPSSTAILRDASVCIVDDRSGDISPSWRVTAKRKSQNLAPALDPVGNRTVAEGSSLSFAVHGTDINDDTLTYSASGLPAGATLNAVTGTVSWTPGYTQRGTYSIVFSASDGLAQASQTATITVQPTNLPPVLAPIGNKTAYIGTVFTLNTSATDPNGGTLTYSASPKPPGATMNATTGTMTWSVSGSVTYAPSYATTIRVTDSTGLSDSETITIYVRTFTCFLAGTPITMADGSTRPIEDVRVGDQVRSFDEKTGRFRAASVRHVMIGSSAMHLVVNGSIRVTETHPLRVNDGWVTAGRLALGDRLLRSDGTVELVASIERVEGEATVYNFEVAETHTFCASGVVAHNKPPPGS